MSPKIFILYTGGTAGMKASSDGYRPCAGYLQEQLARSPKFNDPRVPRFDIEELSPLLDSANMTPSHWGQIAKAVESRYDDYDGFIVIHGTDTMAYTASALSFMLENTAKPVVLTGAQVPLAEVRNDAESNLLLSLMFLGGHHRRMSEVFVCFDNLLLRGNRTTKVDADAFAALDSPNFPHVGRAGTSIEIEPSLLRPPPPGGAPFNVIPIGNTAVAAVRLFPGIRAEYLINMLLPPVEGVVLECFGAGTMPSDNKPLLRALEAASLHGQVVVAVTQCVRGTADLGLYETGSALESVGVVSGFDMTAEAALTKLLYLFAKGYTQEETRVLMGKNLRGELTPPNADTAS